MAYSFFIGPVSVFFFVFIQLDSLLPIKGFKDTLFKELQPLIPDSGRAFLLKTIQDIISIKHKRYFIDLFYGFVFFYQC